jgi:hypothetical protein
MHQLLRVLLGAVLIAGLASAVGCGPTPSSGSGSTTKVVVERTPGQYFKDQQSATMTPNGKIMIGTVTEKDGKIEYATEDGKRWRVSYSERADGTYQYGTPDEVK